MNKLLILLILFLCFSCEKAANWELQNETIDKVVIEAVLTDEKREQSIKLTQLSANINESANPIIGAKVTIIEGSNSFLLSEKQETPGLYYTDSLFFAKPDIVYRIIVTVNNESYTASGVLATGFNERPLQYSLNTELGLYKIDWPTATYHPINPTMWEVYLDWTHLYGLQDTTIDSCNAKLCYYSLPTIDVSQVFAPENEKIYFPKGSVIWIKRYALSDEYAEYLRALMLETNWRGGFLDSQPSNLPSNFSNGALGFFSVCSVSHSLQYAGY